ncbi:MAG: hypothetical protein WBV55_08465 [Candidatus Sulfotelmatobacter sp.]
MKRIAACRAFEALDEQYDGGKRVPATVAAISDAVRWAEEIMREIDSRWPSRQ